MKDALGWVALFVMTAVCSMLWQTTPVVSDSAWVGSFITSNLTVLRWVASTGLGLVLVHCALTIRAAAPGRTD